jgi:hypothetical protein
LAVIETPIQGGNHRIALQAEQLSMNFKGPSSLTSSEGNKL